MSSEQSTVNLPLFPGGVGDGSSLDDLARQIDEEHSKCERAAGHGAMVGQLLLQAKGLLGPRKWASWREANTSLTSKAARMYVSLARKNMTPFKM